MALLALTALLLASCAPSEHGEGTESDLDGGLMASPVITIENNEFINGNVSVEAGTTVTWNWEDDPVAHNVVADHGHFESPLQSDGSWSYTFEEPGVYSYHCRPHPHMTGEVTVVEAPSS